VKKRMKLKKKKKKERMWVVWLELEQLEGQCSHKKPIFVRVYKEECLVSNDNNLSLLSMFQSLLQEFDDVFQDEIPKGLPPIRGIEHKIDFILGQSFVIGQLIEPTDLRLEKFKGK